MVFWTSSSFVTSWAWHNSHPCASLSIKFLASASHVTYYGFLGDDFLTSMRLRLVILTMPNVLWAYALNSWTISALGLKMFALGSTLHASFFLLHDAKIRSSKGVHWPSKCLVRLACLWSKMPVIQRAGMRKEGLPLQPAFWYLIIMVCRACDLNLVMIFSLASKCQGFKLRGFQSNFIKQLKNGHPNYKDLPLWSQWTE